MKVINIKKYENRKLYAPKCEAVSKSRYVNLKEVAEFIKSGYKVNVTRNSDKADITNEVLREILTGKEVEISSETIYGIIRG